MIHINNNYIQFNLRELQGKKHSTTYILIHLTAIIAIIVILFLLITKDSSTYKNAVNTFCKGLDTANYSEIEKILPPELKNSNSIIPFKTFIEELKKIEENKNAQFNVTCEINDTKKLDKNDVINLQEDYQNKYQTHTKITNAYNVKFTYKMELEYEGKSNTNEEDMSVTIIEINKKWYFLDF